MNDRQKLEAVVDVVRSYLPPDGISREEAMSQIIALVDPLPAQPEQREKRMTDREAIQKALDTPHRRYSIKPHGNGYAIYRDRDLFHHGFNLGHLTEVTPETIELIENALNTTLAQPEQEPVAYMTYKGYLYHASDPKVLEHSDPTPLYTAPPSKPWVSLTDEEIDYIWGVTPPDYENFFEFPRAIEAKLREKNT